MADIDNVPLDSVRINGGTQSRAALSQSTIAEYAEAIRLAVELPPVVLFFDGVHFWLADGFHRYHAHREAGAMEIAAEIRTGTQRDAVLYSVGANASHGLRRSNEDKRKAVETLLADPEWATWSNNAIAKACAVSDKTVATYRAEHLRNSEDSQTIPAVRTVQRNGTTYEQNTANIGKPTAPAVAAVTPPSMPPTNAPAAGMALASASATSSPTAAAPVDQGSALDADPSESARAGLVPQAIETPSIPPSEVEQLREQIAQLQAALQETLADNTDMGRVFDADDRLQAAMDEIKRHKANAASAKQSLDTEMGKNTELIRTVKRLTRDLEKEKKRADEAERQLAQMRSEA